jgi:hypothetical protein
MLVTDCETYGSQYWLHDELATLDDPDRQLTELGAMLHEGGRRRNGSPPR